MSDEGRPQRRNRPRRRQEGGSRRQQPRPSFPRRRNDFASGQYSSVYSGPFPTDDDELEGGLNLADLQAKGIEELRELAGEHGIEKYDELEHSDLVLKLLDVLPLATSPQKRPQDGTPGEATGILEIVDEGFGFLRR
ncbi:MAG TPA: Rho termination factor N-terminal domain-containing protein, partial [Candidatus Limnocylindrales bacterium]|nr:Rho termination factor N-terminal domain-containing protein [Candidatus Limnocylindrales bacterium]